MLDEKMEDIPYCADSCGRAATTERLVGVFVPQSELSNLSESSDLSGFDELVELVCVHCLKEAA